MLDFMKVCTRPAKGGYIEVFPEFIVKRTKDLMIRGSDFYAIWDEDMSSWTTDPYEAVRLIDNCIDRYIAESMADVPKAGIRPLYLRNGSNKMIDTWNHYVQKQARDNYHPMDETIIFANDEKFREQYSSHSLSYPLAAGTIENYSKLMDALYDPAERRKLEWAIGAVVSGDSKKIQKFVVIYGSAGTGKSTFLNIVQMLFDGYYSVFEAKALGNPNASFALESFKSNPLVAIQQDGDLSRIEDNTRLNSLIAHEEMVVNEKYRTAYSTKFNSFLFMGTNKPVRITDSRSGIIRRLIDVNPSGRKLPRAEYERLYSAVQFELGAIAQHCLEVYQEDPSYYDDYIPISMIGASNDFYNFMEECYEIFKKEDKVQLDTAWNMYKQYCEEARIPYPLNKRTFKEELKNYFKTYEEKGLGGRHMFYGFISEKFYYVEKKPEMKQSWIRFSYTMSSLDHLLCDMPAQYANDSGFPMNKWSNVATTLKDLDTTRLHYVKLPSNHIVIDFDLKGPDGQKSIELNMEAASKFPATYAELSKSGSGIHLHYIWAGDVDRLSSLFAEGIEVKVYKGNSALRRKVSYCNNEPLKTINSGLPLKGEGKVVDFKGFENDRHLRMCILKAMRKEIFPNTRPSVDYIYKCLEGAFAQGLTYDMSDLHSEVLAFAAGSTHQADYCVALVSKMRFKSEAEPKDIDKYDDSDLVFFDIEVFPNLLLLCYKMRGKDKECVRWFNPSPEEVKFFISKFKLVGFNCRRYDNHVLYGRALGNDNDAVFRQSFSIIDAEKTAGKSDGFYANAYNLSYTDVYDFASAQNKQSLKKWEIQLGLYHIENEYPWDQPLPEDKWDEVADYCCNDVISTEAVFDYLVADWNARRILAAIAGKTVNTTSNQLTTQIIFGDERDTQKYMQYRNLAEPVKELPQDVYDYFANNDILKFPFSEESLLPYWPGYKFENGKSTYKGVEVGEGGYVYDRPGMYANVALLDVASMHPHSAFAECLFGPKYTQRFRDLVGIRLCIKHKDMDKAKTLLNGALKQFLEDSRYNPKDLSNALKTPINAVYGLTAAKFDNPFRDPRNIDNIVAKRGALFMIDLKEEVERRGYVVAHIKTDSIKIPNATPEIIQFVMDYGKKYGYTFEHEATYERMCLVNGSTYICRERQADGSVGPWKATAAQFAHPYVYKTLFSGEPIEFEDMCETKAVKTRMLLRFEDGKTRFVGKVGQFCPVVSGGAELVREATARDGSTVYGAVTGTKDYKWLESEVVREAGIENKIDVSYFRALVDDARDNISQYGDFDNFVSGGPIPSVGAPWLYPSAETEEGIPWTA